MKWPLSAQHIRWIRLRSVVLLALGGVVFVLGLMVPWFMPVFMPVGICILLGGFVLWGIMAFDHYLRITNGLPPVRFSPPPRPAYVCPQCGYSLRGVQGMFCPECGTARPVALDGDEDDDDADSSACGTCGRH